MNGKGHRLSTKKAFDILKDINDQFQIISSKDVVAEECVKVDDYKDVEFVDVEGGIGDGGRDNPHEDEFFAIDDEAHKTYNGSSFTAFNHFIDIKKGPGIFDDYDGYSYKRGSAHSQEYEAATNEADSIWEKIAGTITGKKVDEGINWWYNDEYVHAACHKWYKNCSPAMSRYSFPQDKGTYNTVNAELSARFPLAESTEESGKGIPSSVFMPIDNLARYWHNQYLIDKNPVSLGPVMHAIQDASIPHHAAGYCGNWHGKYESKVADNIEAWLNDVNFTNEVKQLVNSWSHNDANPPTHLAQNEWNKIPAQNWRIDMLVTWVALNAYKEYSQTYNNFSNGNAFQNASARNLTKLAVAVCVLILKRIGELQYKENLMPFSTANAKTEKIADKWFITDGAKRILNFGTEENEAKKALSIIKHYNMNCKGWVGNATDPDMEYFLCNNLAPSGAFAGEDSIPFNPEKLEVKLIEGKYYITEGDHYILYFGDNHANAVLALYIIMKYGFKYICYVGRPKASMKYFRI